MSLQLIINESLLAEQEKRKGRERSGKISPSSLGRCYRYQFWNRKNEPQTNPPDTRTLRIFKVGKMFHNFIQQFLPKHEVEVKVESDDILGFADVVTEDCVYDIKSQHSKGFWYMAQEGYDIKKGRYTNILQLMTYAYMLKKPKGVLCIVSKDDLCINEYVFHLSNWENDIIKELTILRKIWEEGKLPKPEARAYGGKECNYCGYKTKCEGIKD